MRALTNREKLLLGSCFAVIFLVANAFAARFVVKNLRGSGDRITELRNQLADHEMWLADAEKAAARERWLDENMPRSEGRISKELGDLLQSMQDQLYERKIKIEQQSMQETVTENFYTEVAVRFSLRGDEKEVVDWLAGLQGPDKFVVVKSLELKIDPRAQEEEPQAICQITVAKWVSPEPGTPEPEMEAESQPETEPAGAVAEPEAESTPEPVETTSEPLTEETAQPETAGTTQG